MKKILLIIKLVILVLAVTVLNSCRNNEDIRVSKNPEITSVAAPIVLQPDSTVIELSDYFRHPKLIDSVFITKGLAFRFTQDSSQMIISVKDKNFPRISAMTVYAEGYPYSLILEKSPKIWYHFTFNPGSEIYKGIEITGDMNNWSFGKNVLRLKDGKWQTDMLLTPGKYDYLLVIDGKMIPDPTNPEKTQSYPGGWNSVLHAGNLNPAGTPYLFTQKVTKDQISIGIKNKTTELFVLWDNHLLDSTFWKPDSAGINIKIPRKAKDFNRSYIRLFAYNNAGISNQVMIPLNEGKVIREASDLTREDKEAMIIYFMMVDRFANGNPNNDFPVKDSLLDRRLNFMGGDLSGILQKLEEGYFKNLGVNTLWISPVVQNPSGTWPDFNQGNRKSTGYHGYWPVSLSTTDKHFGTADEMKSLAEEAHSNDLNIILDLISNRVHKDSYLYKQHPEWTTPLLLPEGKKKNLRLWREEPYTTWWEEYLPTLDLSNTDVCSMMSDSALYWIKAFELDGFRHDAINHVPDQYWRILTRKLKENVTIPDNRPVFQIGECYENRASVAEYVSPGKLDAVFDINLYMEAGKTFARDNASFRDLASALKESMNYYGDHSLMGNMSGNQDLPRFISYASGALTPGEDYIRAGWDRNIQVIDTAGYSKLAMLHAFNMTIPGIPVIYYGDEIGMAGAGEPDNRRMMRFDSLNYNEAKLKDIVSSLCKLRRNSMPLIYGDLRLIESTDKVLVYMRNYFDKAVIVIFNKNRTPEKVTFQIPERFKKAGFNNLFGNKFTISGNNMTVSMNGDSFEILSN